MTSAYDEYIKQQSNGTWTIDMDHGDVKPIIGIPTLDLARRIAEQMWAMEREGARSALSD